MQEKISEIEEITQLLKQHKAIGIASLQKVRAAQLQEFKKRLAEKVYMRVIKNTLMKMAIENCEEKPEMKKLLDHLTGSNVYLFTDLNPFRLALILERGKIKATAKSGDIAAFDVVVPAGNTGQPPGPIISQLNAVGLPTRIESGSVWINKDTLVVRKGEAISERLASVLSKLGIKPVEAGLSMKVAFDEGLIITQELLGLDPNKTRQNIREAQSFAFALSLGTAYPTKENAQMLLQVAHREAYLLSVNAAAPNNETIAELIRKAYMEMLSLSSRLPSLKEKGGQAEKSEKTKIVE
ncbi:MAG: 50S ribosomal protein L10 [Candidatus Bathyarchaeota archaeon]|nr:50S ribosomal protein L10 [Candidatus Bathyarchaeota archaeon]